MLKNVRQRRSHIAQRLNVRPRVRLATSLAAALLDGPFEHPVKKELVGGELGRGGGRNGISQFLIDCHEPAVFEPIGKGHRDESEGQH